MLAERLAENAAANSLRDGTSGRSTQTLSPFLGWPTSWRATGVLTPLGVKMLRSIHGRPSLEIGCLPGGRAFELASRSFRSTGRCNGSRSGIARVKREADLRKITLAANRAIRSLLKN